MAKLTDAARYNVYLPAWEQGVLPSNQAILSSDLVEDRRLGYVATARAPGAHHQARRLAL